MTAAAKRERRATLYRMVTDEHVCPWGLKARDLLRRRGFEVDDRPLGSREETEAFKREHGVDTTPQIWIGDERVGGYDALREHLGEPARNDDATSYQPVIAVFAVALAMALATGHALGDALVGMRTLQRFVAISMCILAILKLRDLESFSTTFLTYDLLARRVVRYAYVYPFAEALAGVLMLAGALLWLAAPMALVIGGVGAVSVIRAVWIEGRELRCACVGGDSNVPLGSISLTENLMMVAMGLWMWPG